MVIEIRKTEENATPLVRAALTRLQLSEEKEKVLRFEKGTYNFFGEGAYEGYFTVSNNYSGEKRVVFPVLDFPSLTVDGGGSVFLFHNRLFPFIIRHSQNVTLRNFTLDYSFPRFTQGEVTGSNEQGFSLKIDKEAFPYQINEEGNIVFKTGEAELSSRERIMFFQSYTHAVGVCYLTAGKRDYEIGRRPAPVLQTAAEEKENGEIFFRYERDSYKQAFKIGDTMLLNIDECRENDCIFADESKNILVQDVHIRRGAGMGFIAQLCTDIRLQRFQIFVPPERKELYSTTADGIMFCNCDGKAEVSECLIADTVDDPLNSHGAYAEVKRMENGVGMVAFNHLEQGGRYELFRENDEVIVCDSKGVDKGRARVLSSVPQGDELALTLSDGGLLAVGDYVENYTRMPRLTIENSRFFRCPHVRVSGSGKIILRNNRFIDVDFPVHISDQLDFWYESGRTTEVVVEGNVFEGAYAPIWIGASKGERKGALHGTIRIVDNLFSENNRNELSIAQVENLIFTNNRCLFTDNLEKSLTLQDCNDVFVKDNQCR